MAVTKDITALLVQIRHGDRSAQEALIPLVYDELRRLARRQLRRERPNHTLQTTALVHEVYLKLVGGQPIDFKDRSHFFTVAASAMRRILVDYARVRNARKRGGYKPSLALDEEVLNQASDGTAENTWSEILAVHQALARLESLDQRQARIVELRFFAGLDTEEIADVLGVSSRTVKRDWRFAQSWLFAQMAGGPEPQSLASKKRG